MTLSRWDPFRDVMSLREAMDRLFEESFVRPWFSRGEYAGLPVEMYETDKEVVVKAPLPGFKAGDVDLEFHNGVLTIKAERQEEREEKEATYHLREYRVGRFYRQLTLPADVNADKAEAAFEDGILTLRFPKAQKAQAKKIKVKGK
ncbi:MAG: Hsp20/alpha crystallin family protein [Ardenticatenia bacterium]|nr:Hsp20/alpha crystallin family protein [Ardenticatenia bacterium]